MAPSTTSSASTSINHPPIPLVYKIFFLYLEPAMVCWAAFMGYAHPLELLSMLTRTAYAPAAASAPTIEMIHQLCNEYLVIAVLQAGVLRCTADRRVWRVFLWTLLAADALHLFNLGTLGWNLSEGVLVGMAVVRVAFLLGYH